jgi:putative ABC transport system permease protein
MRMLFTRLRARLRYRRFNDELREELRVHEALKREALERDGMTSDEATIEARRALGNVVLMREAARAVWIAAWLDRLHQDVRYALRSIRREPILSLTSIAVLVLGIGVNASLFTMFKAVALEQWPARDPDRIVEMRAVARGRVIGPSVDEYHLVRARASSFSGVAARMYGGAKRVQASGFAETFPQTEFVSANFLDVLGARMHLGSAFIPDDDLPGDRRRPVVIGYSLWATHFAGDPSVVGRPVTLDGKPFTIVGVLEQRVYGLKREVGLWLPLSALASIGPVMSAGIEPSTSGNCCIEMMGRLRDGVGAERARTELQVLHEQLAATARRDPGRVEVYGTAYISRPGPNDLGIFRAVAVATGLVLILACANVGNLQLARGLARRREIATRLSLGASRMRIVWQLMAEGLVLTSVAGAASIGVAAFLPSVVFRLINDGAPLVLSQRLVPDGQVAFFIAGVSVLACLAFALAPAFQATRHTIPLRLLDRASTRRTRFTLRSTFLAAQVAACAVLLAGAGLLTRAILHAQSFDTGFTSQLTLVHAWLPSETPDAERSAFTSELFTTVEHELHGRVAATDFSPLAESWHALDFVLPGEDLSARRSVVRRRVSRGYFGVLGIPLVKGRSFQTDAVSEVVVNEAFVRTYFQGDDPLGRTIRDINQKGTVTRTSVIVGVARDAYLNGLTRIDPLVFMPRAAGIFVTNDGPAAAERIRAIAIGLNRAATVRVWPLSDDLRDYLEPSRFGAGVAWAIGLLGLVLAVVGVFGVFAYAVEERRREIGIRLALGAARRQIVTMLVATSGRALMIGLAVGMLVSLASGSVLRSYLYGLSPIDPLAYGMALSLLAAAAATATVVPARRACRVDPAITLRHE